MPELTAAIQSLYDTFSRYPRPVKIESCPCGCTPPNATTHIVALPLRQLNFADLTDFCFSAMTTQGSVDDFRYLLPRLFEGVATEPCGVNLEILLGKLQYAKWTTWPPAEVQAIKTYLRALWEKALDSFPLHEHLPALFEIETMLASIAVTGEALEPYLELWSATQTKAADEHLIQFVTMFGSEFSHGQTFHEAFWANCQPQAEVLRQWLLRPDTLRRIENICGLLREDGFQHLFAPALNVLRQQAPTT